MNLKQILETINHHASTLNPKLLGQNQDNAQKGKSQMSKTYQFIGNTKTLMFFVLIYVLILYLKWLVSKSYMEEFRVLVCFS